MMTEERPVAAAWGRLIREDFERRMKAASLSVKRLDSGVYFSPIVHRAWEAEKIIGSALPTYSQAELDAAVAAERQRCVAILECYQVSVGNSRAGELACEWTMDALRECVEAIRDNPTKQSGL